MADFNFVTARLATGAAIASPADVDALAAAGITAIIDCRDDFDDAPLLAKFGGLYLWNGTADDGKKKGEDWFGKSLAFALPLFAHPHARLYCHCAAGINRGPSTAYAVLLALGFPAALARAMIIAHRPRTLVGIRYADDAEAALKALGFL